MRRALLPLGALALALGLGGVEARAAWNPPDWEERPVSEVEAPVAAGAVLMQAMLGFYRASITGVDGSRCPSVPTCSAYAVEAVRRHGALGGAALTSARLISESDEAAFAPHVLVDGVLKVYYPVEDSVFPSRKAGDDER